MCLPTRPSLRRLHFNSCDFVEDCRDVAKLLASFGDIVGLTHLLMTATPIDADEGANLIKAVKRLNKLENLDLGLIAPDPDLEPLIDACPELKYFALNRENRVDGAILARVISKWPMLKTLNLSGAHVKNLAAVCSSLQHCHALTELDLSLTRMDPSAAVTLSLQLKHLTSLVSFSLHFNRLGPKPSIILARNMQHLTRLEYLDLRSNLIASSELRDALMNMPHLRTLNLEQTNFRPESCVFLNTALAQLPQLTFLNIGENELGSRGLDELVSGFSSLSQLRSIAFPGSKFTPNSICTLATLFQFWPRLLDLDAGHNHVGDVGAQAIADHLHHLQYLRKLSLDESKINERGKSVLAKAITPLRFLKKADTSSLDDEAFVRARQLVGQRLAQWRAMDGMDATKAMMEMELARSMNPNKLTRR